MASMNWGDIQDDESSTYTMPASHSTNQGLQMPAVPASIVSKVDAAGVRTVVEYGTNEKGQKIKITKKVKTVMKTVQVPRRVIERQSWKKFGECAGLPPGPEPNVTYTSIEVINLDLRPKKREEEKEESSLDKLSAQASIVVCRHCGSTGHWTLKCPKRSQITPSGVSMDEPSAAATSSSAEVADKDKYVPVHMRGGAAGGGGRQGGYGMNDDATLRVTNISEETTEADLGVLFRKFGHTTRIFLAKDRHTGVSRGFAFISYSRRDEAQQAINKLNGHGYDNLILHVEWAKPREKEAGADE